MRPGHIGMLGKCVGVSLVLSTSLIGRSARAEDWPRWRGPRGDGISTEVELGQKWPAKGLKKIWSAPAGEGFSSPVAVNGVVYLFHQHDGAEHLTALDAATGKVLWSESDKGGWTGSYPGTRATPTIEGGVIYTFGGHGDLTARQLATGARLWRLNVLQAVGAQPLDWGAASSPLVSGDLVVVQTGAGGPIAAAVHRTTGALAWKSDEIALAGYAPLILAEVGGQRQVIVAGGEEIVALQPQTGKKIWSVPFRVEYNVNAATPIYRDGALLVAGGYGTGAMQLKLTNTSASQIWKTTELRLKFNPAVYDAGFLYANSEGSLECVDWKSGQLVWKAKERDLRVGEGGSLVRVGDKVISLSDRGVLTLLQATPAGYKKLSQFEATDGKEIWATPLLYKNRLYVRGQSEITAWAIH